MDLMPLNFVFCQWPPRPSILNCKPVLCIKITCCVMILYNEAWYCKHSKLKFLCLLFPFFKGKTELQGLLSLLWSCTNRWNLSILLWDTWVTANKEGHLINTHRESFRSVFGWNIDYTQAISHISVNCLPFRVWISISLDMCLWLSELVVHAVAYWEGVTNWEGVLWYFLFTLLTLCL